MRDGNYTVKKVVEGKRKGECKVILANVPKTDCIYTSNPSVTVGTTVTVRSNRITAVRS